MAVTLSFTNNHVEDANGLPYVGAKLYVCNAGTTVLSSIYSDRTLSTPATNPLTSNAAGDFDRFYLAAGEYKLRAEQSDSTGIGLGTLIREEDYIDTGVGTGGVVPVASGGTGGTTAAAARTNLGAAAQTDVDDLTSDIADLQTSLQNVVSIPQGYLTLTSGTPVIATGVTAGTSVYYTPYVGNLAPIWNGTQHIIYDFDELTLTLNANHVANTLYDVFLTLDSGEPILVTGPAWNTITAGSGARGSGAGSTELERKGGLYTNKVAMTARNGATTYSIEANKGTYLGTILMDGSNGQITCHRDWGSSRRWGVWNAYNRRKCTLRAGDSTASWTYASSTWRPSRNQSTNSLIYAIGLQEELVNLSFKQKIQADAGDTTSIAIGYNSTTAPSGQFVGELTFAGGVGELTTGTVRAESTVLSAIGRHDITSLEAASVSVNLYGTEPYMVLQAEWQG